MIETQCTTGRENRLAARLWQPDGPTTRGCVIIVHGLGEHGGRYEPVASQLAGAGWASLAADLQGHGKSPGRRGHVPSYFGLLQDIDAMRQTVRTTMPDAPQVLLGHSMGGNLATNYVLRRRELDPALPPLAGLVLSGPMFLPTNPPNRAQVFAAWLTGYLVPWLTVRTPVDINKLTRNPATADAIRNDQLAHGRISVYVATQLLAQGRFALDQAGGIDVPTLLMHGEDDPITSYRASESFALRAGDHVKFVSFPGMLHEIFHEANAATVFETLLDWLSKLPLPATEHR
ncbi:MAG: alpha/beta hydrolase [Planctomycetaceae bacterium]